MHAEAPGLLGWSSLLLAVAALYLFRRRPRELRVSTLPFFTALAQVYQESAWLRRLKRLLSFLLSAAVVLLGAGALAGLTLAPQEGEARTVVVLLDGSASMGARDGEGRSRLEVGKAWVRRRLAGLPAGAGVLVVRYDRRPEVVLPRTYDRRQVTRAIEQAEARPLEGDPAPALELARRLASLEPPAAVWHVTDEGGSPASDSDSDSDSEPSTLRGVRVETLQVGLPAPTNAGITAFALRRLPLEQGRLEAFVELRGVAPRGEGGQELEANLEVRLDQALVGLRAVTLTAGRPERLLLPLDARQGQVLTLRVRVEGDVLAADDLLQARIPPLDPVRVAWVAESPDRPRDPFTRLALAALDSDGEVEVFPVAAADWSVAPAEAYDVAVFDGVLPAAWPEGLAVVAIAPPRALGPLRAAPLDRPLPVDALRSIDGQHPLLYGVASERVRLTQTAVLDGQGALAPLWVGPAGPLLVAGEVRGQRVVALAFSPAASEALPYMASYPLLLGNALLWASAPGAEAREGRNLPTGAVVEAAGDAIEWLSTGDPLEASRPLRVSRPSHLTELDRVGLWRIGEVEGSAALRSPRETLLAAAAPEAVERAQRDGVGGAVATGELRPLLLALLLAVLLSEAYLLHRRGVF